MLAIGDMSTRLCQNSRDANVLARGEANLTPSEPNRPGDGRRYWGFSGAREASNQPALRGPVARWPRRPRPESARRKAKKKWSRDCGTASRPHSLAPFPSSSSPFRSTTHRLANLPQGPLLFFTVSLFLSVGFPSHHLRAASLSSSCQAHIVTCAHRLVIASLLSRG